MTAMLTPAPQDSAIVAAAQWIEGVLLGPLATSASVLAVAGVGLFMLAGRIDVRNALRVVLGCFILFGASTIARGIRSATGVLSETAAAPNVEVPLVRVQPSPPAPTPRAVASDPYAGASVPR